jgi:hypothetical protein
MTASPWQQTDWWRVVAPDSTIWAETSNEEDARERMRPGDTLYRQWWRVEQAWLPVREDDSWPAVAQLHDSEREGHVANVDAASGDSSPEAAQRQHP